MPKQKSVFGVKKLIISFLTVIYLIFFGVVTHVSAQNAQGTATSSGTWYNQSFPQWSAKVFDEGNPNEIFGERYTYAQVNWIINSLIAVLIGNDIAKCIAGGVTGNLSQIGVCAKALYTFPSSNPTNTLQPSVPSMAAGGSGGITGLAYLTSNLISFKPASGIQYVKSTAANLNIIPHAYAQSGAGYPTISPVQSLCSLVRDISYALMIIIIIAMAFMIMFRAKISPQVVVTVQSSLPKIAIALVLITFSYAIAGFLIDLMYVIIGTFATTIKIGGSTISSGSVPYLFGQLNSINGLISITLGLLIVVVLLAVGVFLSPFAAVAGTFVLPVFGTTVGILGGVILLIGLVFILWILLRLFWLMIKTATITVLLIVASPLMILMDLLPGSGGFMQWFRILLANLSVYPTVIIMLFLSHYFFWSWAAGWVTQVWPPTASIGNPFNTYAISSLNLNGTSGVINLPGMPIGTSVIGFFASFMIIFLIPKAAEIIQAIIEGKGINQGAAIGEAVGPSRGVALFGAASVFTQREKIASGLGNPTPSWVQTGRRLLGIRS